MCVHVNTHYPLDAGALMDALGFKPRTSQASTKRSHHGKRHPLHQEPLGRHPFEEEKIPIRSDANKKFLYICNPLFSLFFQTQKTMRSLPSRASGGFCQCGSHHGQSGTADSALMRTTQEFSRIIKQNQCIECLAHAMLITS